MHIDTNMVIGMYISMFVNISMKECLHEIYNSDQNTQGVKIGMFFY